MAQHLHGVEIMRTGTFTPGGAAKGRKVTITEADLDQMVESFDALGSNLVPVLKLGHAEAQRFMGQDSGAPNLGIVEKIVRVGEKVLANFANVPDAVIELIRQKRFTNVSVEIVPSLDIDGKTFANVLTAVALLGAELPAVSGLKELAELLFVSGMKAPAYDDAIHYSLHGDDTSLLPLKGAKVKEDTMTVTYTQEQHDALVEAAVAKAVKVAKDEYTAEAEKITAERDDAIKAVKVVKDEFTAYSDKVANAEAETMVDEAIKAGKLLPKQKDAALAFATNLSGTIKFDDKDTSMRTMFADFLGSMPPKVDTTEVGPSTADETQA